MGMSFKPVMLTISVSAMALLLNQVTSAGNLVVEDQAGDTIIQQAGIEVTNASGKLPKIERSQNAIEAINTMVERTGTTASREIVAVSDDKGTAGEIASQEDIQRVWTALEAAQSKPKSRILRTEPMQVPSRHLNRLVGMRKTRSIPSSRPIPSLRAMVCASHKSISTPVVPSYHQEAGDWLSRQRNGSKHCRTRKSLSLDTPIPLGQQRPIG